MDITNFVIEANGDLDKLYRIILAANDNDFDKADRAIEEYIKDSKDLMQEGLEERGEGEDMRVIAVRLPVTRESYAEQTTREFYKEAFATGVKLTEEQEKQKIKFYATRPNEAAEDGVIL